MPVGFLTPDERQRIARSIIASLSPGERTLLGSALEDDGEQLELLNVLYVELREAGA